MKEQKKDSCKQALDYQTVIVVLFTKRVHRVVAYGSLLSPETATLNRWIGANTVGQSAI